MSERQTKAGNQKIKKNLGWGKNFCLDENFRFGRKFWVWAKILCLHLYLHLHFAFEFPAKNSEFFPIFR